MKQCGTDPCVFSLIVKGKVEMILAGHIDGIAMAGSDETCRDFHAALITKFPTNNLDELTWYNWLCFQARPGTGHTSEVTHKAFVESMLNRFGVNPSSDIPATSGVELGLRQEGETKGEWPYREAVGSLMWLSTMTRPDIPNAVRAVAPHYHNPTADRHWKAGLKIMANLDGTRGMGSTFVSGSGSYSTAYSDADCADKPNDRRSVSGVRPSVGQEARRGGLRCPQQKQGRSA